MTDRQVSNSSSNYPPKTELRPRISLPEVVFEPMTFRLVVKHQSGQVKPQGRTLLTVLTLDNDTDCNVIKDWLASMTLI